MNPFANKETEKEIEAVGSKILELERETMQLGPLEMQDKKKIVQIKNNLVLAHYSYITYVHFSCILVIYRNI